MADSAYIFGRTLREFPSALYDSISPAQVPTGMAPDLTGAGNVLGGVAFDAMQSAYQNVPSDPVPSGLQIADPVGVGNIWRGLTGGESTPVQEPLSAPPPPPTPQPATPAQGSRFEGGGPAPWEPMLQTGARMLQNGILRFAQTPQPFTAKPPAFAQTTPQPVPSTDQAGPPAPMAAPLTYSDRVMANLNKPFMEKYNSLRYGKPLDFSPGADSRVLQYAPQTALGKDQQGVSMEGKSAMQIVDRPMTLAELDPMVVHEKDWTAYLKAVTDAASTPDFDASKDPAVLQQLEQLNTAYWKFKAAKKEQALLDKRSRLLEMDAQAAEYRAGLKSASNEEQARFQKERIEEKAAFLEKQARLLDNHDWSQGYSDDEKQAVAEQAAKLREQAGILRSGGEAEYNQSRDQSRQEYKSWWSEQVGKIREGQAKIDEARVDASMQGQMAKSAADMAQMQFLAVGQTREEDKRQQEAALAYQTTQRQLMQENKLLARQERQSKAEMAVANNASALAGLKAQKLKDQLNQYESDGFGGFTDKVDGHQLTPEEVQAVKGMYAEFAQLSNQQVGIKENLLSRNLAQNPGAAAYLPVRTPAAAPPSAQPEKVVYPDSSLWMKAKK